MLFRKLIVSKLLHQLLVLLNAIFLFALLRIVNLINFFHIECRISCVYNKFVLITLDFAYLNEALVEYIEFHVWTNCVTGSIFQMSFDLTFMRILNPLE